MEHEEDAAINVFEIPHRVVWQVELDKAWGLWFDYPPDQSRQAEDAWQSEAESVRVGVTDEFEGWLLVFQHMHQVSESGKLRRLRRVLLTHV